LLIIGQAPGTRVHKTGLPWNDLSGDRLRDWLGLTSCEFYDDRKIAIMPMGFCYPGKGKGGDLPPRPECAQRWHAKVRQLLPDVKLTLLIGRYAQTYYLAEAKSSTLTATVKAWPEYLPKGFLPLVHPSPRNQRWLKRNPWFARQVLPALKKEVRAVLSS
jgi:uracil-DNA glycosylase